MRKDVVHKIAVAILVLAGALVMGGDSARAAELVMFEDPGCSWCRRWHAEVGPAYPLTAEGKVAPLRRIHIRDQATAGVLLERPITATPTFVLAEEGREIGRIVGYPGQDFFYGLLGNLLKPKPRASSLTPILDARIGHSLLVTDSSAGGGLASETSGREEGLRLAAALSLVQTLR